MDRVDAHGLIYLGTFDDEVDAARAYDARARFLGELAKCNFPDDDGSAPMRNARARSSQYRGVHASPSGKFIASLSCKSQMGMDGVDAHNVIHLGSFDDEVDAARAYDARARFLGKFAWCNFDDDHGPAPMKNQLGGRSSQSSEYRGVHAKPNGKFTAALKASSQMGMDGVDAHGHIHLGMRPSTRLCSSATADARRILASRTRASDARGVPAGVLGGGVGRSPAKDWRGELARELGRLRGGGGGGGGRGG